MISAKMSQKAEIVLVDVLDTLDEVKKIQGELAKKLEAILFGR